MHYSTPAATPSSKLAPWFYFFLASLILTAWLTLTLRETEARLCRTAELLARTESRLEKSRTEVRDLKASVDEVKTMVGALAEDLEDSHGDDGEEYADEAGDDGSYLAGSVCRSKAPAWPAAAHLAGARRGPE